MICSCLHQIPYPVARQRVGGALDPATFKDRRSFFFLDENITGSKWNLFWRQTSDPPCVWRSDEDRRLEINTPLISYF